MALSRAEKIGNLYLGYLALLPAVGTFILYGVFDSKIHPLLFLVLGTAAIGIYLAFTGSYVVLSKSAWRNMLMLIDGPLWMGLSLLLGGTFTTAVINNVIVEIAGVLLGVIAVTVTSTIPTLAERRNALIAVGLPLIGVVAVLFTYAAEQGIHGWQLVILAAAALHSAGVQFALGSKGNVQRPSEWIILFGIIAWAGTGFILVPMLRFILGS